ncbi:MAG TPA: NAD(P)/FAD-dependent oxidoreductase [Candidatus Egerieenecus merdigallinarum]|nr:NAD(P)/FAD-dependent oxidoreductase [Candidatus Egerieenecus merdigallinarum]
MNKRPEILVAGGGAAGMMAALFAARAGASVTLLERNEKLGKKIYITGKGRCNLTNDCSLEEFLRQVPRNPRFLYGALNRFGPQDMMALMEEAGCPVEVQRGQRVFPRSEKASDVIRALARLMEQAGVRVRLHSRIQSLIVQEGRAAGVVLENGERLEADAVILALGGQSYPMTGSTGDGYALAREAGHHVLPPAAVLSALETVENWPRALQGLALKNVRLTLRSGRKTLYTELGEMLFTHFGISGPLVLEMSCHLPAELAQAQVTLDLKPGLTPEQLDLRLQRDFAAQPRKQLQNVLPSLLPLRLSALFPDLAGVSGERVCGQITRGEREQLGAALKALPITLRARRPLAEAIVTRGGVDVKEIQPATMESKLLPGLYFAGEMIDVDAHTGGFNLQIAFSTGALAGSSAAGMA